MISPRVRELLRPEMFTASIVWAALTASILIYGLVAYLVAGRISGPTQVPDLLPLALGGVAILTGAGSWLLARILLSDNRLRKAMRSEPTPEALARDPRRGIVDEERLRKIQLLSSSERKLLLLPRLYFTSLILRLTLNESIAVYGVILALLSHSLTPMLPFAAAAIVLNLTCIPRIDPVLERATQFVH